MLRLMDFDNCIQLCNCHQNSSLMQSIFSHSWTKISSDLLSVIRVWHLLEFHTKGSLDGRWIWGWMDTCICMAEFLCYSPKIITISLICYQFSSVAQSCLTLCNTMDCSMPGLPAHYQLLELAQTHVHQVGDAIQPSHPLSSPSPPAFNLSQHQSLFKWVSSSYQVAKVLEFQLQHQSFQSIFMTDFL